MAKFLCNFSTKKNSEIFYLENRSKIYLFVSIDYYITHTYLSKTTSLNSVFKLKN